jgi:hypothetical protein
MINQNLKDVCDALTEADRAILNIKEGYVCELDENIDRAVNAVSEADDQLRYLDEDLNELEEYRDIGDVYELQELEAERDDLKEDLEKATAKGPEYIALARQHKVLESSHAIQREIISALMARYREVHVMTNEESLGNLMAYAAKMVEEGKS